MRANSTEHLFWHLIFHPPYFLDYLDAKNDGASRFQTPQVIRQVLHDLQAYISKSSSSSIHNVKFQTNDSLYLSFSVHSGSCWLIGFF